MDNKAPPIKFLLSGIVFAFLMLIGRLYYLQILRGNYYLERSESNFVQERAIKHSRGKILDNVGNILVDNRLSYDLYVTLALLPDSLRSLRILTAPLKPTRRELGDFAAEINNRTENRINEWIVLGDDVPAKECKNLENITRTELITGVHFQKGYREGNAVCQIAVEPLKFPSHKQTLSQLKTILPQLNDLDGAWTKFLKKAVGLHRFQPTLLFSDIGYDAFARIENAISLGQLSGLNVVPSSRRFYALNNFATHTIGFLNQVSIDDIKQDPSYKSGDYMGRRGIEAAFEQDLRGVDGVERVVVDAKGRRYSETWEAGLLGEVRKIDPTPGHNVKLSLDLDLQRAAEEYFTGKSGSVVVMDVNSGFILASASFPSFNPNYLVAGENSGFIRQLLLDEDRPFRNKVIQDHYSPGSTFKPFTAIAGLNKGLITPSYQHYCSGTYRIHKTIWRCFYRPGHGPITLREALKVSCDNYFYELGHRLTLDNLAESAEKFGFGQKTGIVLAGETPGILPNRPYYIKRSGFVAPGNVVNMSIGQGDLVVSPLQLASAYVALANGGTLYKPQVVTDVLSDDGTVLKKFDREVVRSIADESHSYQEIIEGLSNVVSPGGSAAGLRWRPEMADIFKWIQKNDLTIVGKTGTAQVVALSKKIDHLRPEEVEYKKRDHSWFVGVFPKDQPEIVVVVMTEHGGFGTSSAPVALRLMKKYHELSTTRIVAEGGRHD